MKKIINKTELKTIINDIKTDLNICIQNIEYRERVINLLENSIKNNIEKYKNYDIITSHEFINDFIQIDPVYSLSYTIYNDIQIIKKVNGDIKQINYIPYAAYISIGKYNDNYFYNRYQIQENSFIEKNNKYIVRASKTLTA